MIRMMFVLEATASTVVGNVVVRSSVTTKVSSVEILTVISFCYWKRIDFINLPGRNESPTTV